jgi:hypothetical protein
MKRLLKHINNILVNEQLGFRSKLSTEMASYYLITEILYALNNKILVGRNFLRLRKGFWLCQPHYFTEKIKFYGIAGKAYTLTKSYWENRHQRLTLYVKCFNFCSRWGVIKQESLNDPYFNQCLFCSHQWPTKNNKK